MQKDEQQQLGQPVLVQLQWDAFPDPEDAIQGCRCSPHDAHPALA
jgi:hypothetical protein